MKELFIDKIEDSGMRKIKGRNIRFWKVRCNLCNKIYEARTSNVKKRNRTVCVECAPKLVFKDSYKNTEDPVYATWSLILRRVDNTAKKKTEHDTKYYNGVNICDEWKSFKVFKDWMYKNGWRPGLTIDRKDNSKGYSPDNCRIADYSTQSANRTKQESNTSGYVGVSLTGRPNQPYAARVAWKGEVILQKRFATIKEALDARNNCIKQNNLPHPIQEYKEDKCEKN